jgi:hypothetical protein
MLSTTEACEVELGTLSANAKTSEDTEFFTTASTSANSINSNDEQDITHPTQRPANQSQTTTQELTAPQQGPLDTTSAIPIHLATTTRRAHST